MAAPYNPVCFPQDVGTGLTFPFLGHAYRADLLDEGGGTFFLFPAGGSLGAGFIASAPLEKMSAPKSTHFTHAFGAEIVFVCYTNLLRNLLAPLVTKHGMGCCLQRCTIQLLRKLRGRSLYATTNLLVRLSATI